MNHLDFQGRTAVVTGGAAGIGLAVARRLAQGGAKVSLWIATRSRSTRLTGRCPAARTSRPST